MRSRKYFLIHIILSLLVLLSIFNSNTYAGFLDNVKKKSGEYKKKWDSGKEERKRKYDDFKSKTKKKTKEYKEKWDNGSQNRKKKYEEYKYKAKEKSKEYKTKWDQNKEKRKKVWRETSTKLYKFSNKVNSSYQEHGDEMVEKINNAYSKYGKEKGEEILDYVKECYDRLDTYSHDPETKAKSKKVMNAIVESAVIYKKFDREKKHRIREAVKYMSENTYVQDKYSRSVSLNDYARNIILENAPSLAGTSITEDPAEAFTCMVALRDIGYLTKEMKIIKDSSGDYHTIAESIDSNTPFDADKTIRMIEIADSFDTLGNGDSTYKEILSAATIIENANELK